MTSSATRTAVQLGAALRRRRKALGLSQSELADRIGVRQATISRLESGGGDARVSTLMDAAAALGLELSFNPRDRGGAASFEDLFG